MTAEKRRAPGPTHGRLLTAEKVAGAGAVTRQAKLEMRQAPVEEHGKQATSRKRRAPGERYRRLRESSGRRGRNNADRRRQESGRRQGGKRWAKLEKRQAPGEEQGRQACWRRGNAAGRARLLHIYIVTYFLKPKICSTNPSSNP